jgi:hypothetical protein
MQNTCFSTTAFTTLFYYVGQYEDLPSNFDAPDSHSDNMVLHGFSNQIHCKTDIMDINFITLKERVPTTGTNLFKDQV